MDGGKGMEGEGCIHLLKILQSQLCNKDERCARSNLFSFSFCPGVISAWEDYCIHRIMFFTSGVRASVWSMKSLVMPRLFFVAGNHSEVKLFSQHLCCKWQIRVDIRDSLLQQFFNYVSSGSQTIIWIEFLNRGWMKLFQTQISFSAEVTSSSLGMDGLNVCWKWVTHFVGSLMMFIFSSSDLA